MYIAPIFNNWDLQNQWIILRVDANVVPLQSNTVSYKLSCVADSIQHILQKKARLIVLTHRGRPHGYEASLSNNIIAQWLQNHNVNAHFASSLAELSSLLNDTQIKVIVCENTRFLQNDDAIRTFISFIRKFAHYFIDDAFAVMHRDDTFIQMLHRVFDSTHKSIGPLVTKEISLLNTIITQHIRPAALIAGGGKITEKSKTIPLLFPMLDALFLGPLFITRSNALVHHSSLSSEVQQLIKQAKEKNIALYVPLDFLVQKPSQLSLHNTIQPNPDDIIISCGKNTFNEWKKLLSPYQFVIINGMQGFLDKTYTLEFQSVLLRFLATSSTSVLITGGETTTLATQEHIDTFSNVKLSTGGGATLAYLAIHTLPGLQAFN